MESVTFVKIDSSAVTPTVANSPAPTTWKNLMSIGRDSPELSFSLYGLQFDGYLIVKRPFLSLNVFHLTSSAAKVCSRGKIKTTLIRAVKDISPRICASTDKCKS